MTRYKITIEYDGTDLIGWQENQHGDSAQSLLRDALLRFSGLRPDVYAAGRTDSGVHALAMIAHFDLDAPHSANTVMRALNFYLKNKPVIVLACEEVADDFHARFDCIARHYKYVILNRSAAPVLNKNRVCWVPRPLDVSAMKTAGQKFIGQHDFTSFRASECQAKSPIKTMDSFDVKTNKDEIIFEFSARSFLHHQVRNMVGTLIEIGLGKPMDIEQIFAAKNRSAAGPTAPSSGLYFVSADYATAD